MYKLLLTPKKNGQGADKDRSAEGSSELASTIINHHGAGVYEVSTIKHMDGKEIVDNSQRLIAYHEKFYYLLLRDYARPILGTTIKELAE